MQIKVSKTQRAMNYRTHVGTIIMIAEQKAKAGIDKFKYPVPKDTGYHYLDIINAVETKTEYTVYGYDFVKDGMMTFRIGD